MSDLEQFVTQPHVGIDVRNDAGQNIGVVQQTVEGFQPMHLDGGVGPIFDSLEEARDYMLDEQD